MGFSSTGIVADGVTIKQDTNGKLYVDSLALDLTDAPLKSTIFWPKSFGTATVLPTGWIECNGQAITDPDSPLVGQTAPDLNGALDGIKKFLRGSSTSGTTGGAESFSYSHSHTKSGSGGFQQYDPGGFGMTTASLTQSILPPYYEGVWIMKIKIGSSISSYLHTPTIYTGANFTGSNPNKVLTHSRDLPVNTRMTIGGRPMMRGAAAGPNNEYNISGKDITMNGVVIDDSDIIMVED